MNKSKEENIKRLKGMLYGVAVGDAMGFPYEFNKPPKKVLGMSKDGHFNSRMNCFVPAGVWTDDTSMTLLLLESLIKNKGFNITCQLYSYNRWHEAGYMSCYFSFSFGKGGRTIAAIENFIETTETSYVGDLNRTGNGSLMRVSAIPIYYLANKIKCKHSFAYKDLNYLFNYGSAQSKTTHNIDICNSVAGIHSALLYALAFKEANNKQLFIYKIIDFIYNKIFFNLKSIGDSNLVDFLEYKRYRNDIVDNTVSCDAFDTFVKALTVFYHSSSFKEGMLRCVNFTGDVDSLCSVYGSLAGAHYGYDSIPKLWIKLLKDKSKIEKVFNKLNLE